MEVQSEMSLLNTQKQRSAAFPKTPQESWRVLVASFTLGCGTWALLSSEGEPQSDFSSSTSHEGFAEIILEHSEASSPPAVTTGDLCDWIRSVPHQQRFKVGLSSGRQPRHWLQASDMVLSGEEQHRML